MLNQRLGESIVMSRGATQKISRRPAFRAGYRHGLDAMQDFSDIQPRRRPRLHERHSQEQALARDLDKAWTDFSNAIQNAAGDFFQGNYDVKPKLDENGRLDFVYKRKPLNKKMEDAGGWGK